MAMYNADGSEGKMCGNGVRCIAKYVEYGLTDKDKDLNRDKKAGSSITDLTIERWKSGIGKS